MSTIKSHNRYECIYNHPEGPNVEKLHPSQMKMYNENITSFMKKTPTFKCTVLAYKVNTVNTFTGVSVQHRQYYNSNIKHIYFEP